MYGGSYVEEYPWLAGVVYWTTGVFCQKNKPSPMSQHFKPDQHSLNKDIMYKPGDGVSLILFNPII